MYSTSNSAQSVFFFEGPPDKTFQFKIPPWIPGDEINIRATFTPGKLECYACHVMSCHIKSCHVLSCCVVWCDVMWCVNVMQ